jgi:hypothetical protein
MNKKKQRFDKQITLMHAHRWKDNWELSPKGRITKEQKQLLGIKIVDKKEE